MDIHEYPWISVDFHAIHGYAWITRGYPWMYIHGSSMDIHGNPWWLMQLRWGSVTPSYQT